MNKDQIKVTLKIVTGKAQDTAGPVIGSREQEFRGVKKQVAGKMQSAIGGVQVAEETDKK